MAAESESEILLTWGLVGAGFYVVGRVPSVETVVSS